MTTPTVSIGPVSVLSDVGGAVDISVAEAGGGGRPLLLLHGFTGAKEDFADWFEPLAADGWWVVAPDQRGHGDSSKPTDEAEYSFDIYVADLLALVDRLGWRSFSLLGHSMGGMIAQELTLSEPARVDRLVLMDTHHGALDVFEPEVVAMGLDVLRTQGLPALIALLDQFPTERAPAEERIRATRPGYVEMGERKLQAASPAMYAAMVTAMVGRADRLADLASISQPTRVVVGEQDRGFLSASRRMAEAIPGADLVVIPDAAHSPQFENPDGWWAAVAPFLAAGALAG